MGKNLTLSHTSTRSSKGKPIDPIATRANLEHDISLLVCGILTDSNL